MTEDHDWYAKYRREVEAAHKEEKRRAREALRRPIPIWGILTSNWAVDHWMGRNP